MSDSAATLSPAAVTFHAYFAGTGHGWHVRRRVILDGSSHTTRVDGPFTTREQAEARAARLAADTYSVPRDGHWSRTDYWRARLAREGVTS